MINYMLLLFYLPGKNGVKNTQTCRHSWDEGPNLCHDSYERHLSDVRALASHVGTSHDHHTLATGLEMAQKWDP
jgi:hypothetical protein